MANLQTSSQEIISTRRRGWQTKRVKTLKQLACTPGMEPVYSIEYLQIVVANTMFADAVNQCLNQSAIPMEIRVDQNDSDYFNHTCHSYPECSENREQHEYRCIDPGHTLTNMRSQISRHGYDFCSKAAFVLVSERNHKVLPKSIVEDRLDKVFAFLSTSFPVTLNKSCKTMVMMPRLNLYALLETGSRPAMNEELTSTLR